MYETENRSRWSLWTRRDTSVDLPDPDGAEMMNTVVTLVSACPLFEIQRLLAHLLDICFGGEREIGQEKAGLADAGCFR